MKYHRQLISIILWLILLVSSASPAMAQRTSQRADRNQLIVMVAMSAISLAILGYFRIP
jgi:heme/copper-type cytochrome/quinol oxidase subunit 3